jgi:hypothetical protein
MPRFLKERHVTCSFLGKVVFLVCLKGHAPIISTLVEGKVKVEASLMGIFSIFIISGGVVEVNNRYRLIVLADKVILAFWNCN